MNPITVKLSENGFIKFGVNYPVFLPLKFTKNGVTALLFQYLKFAGEHKQYFVSED
jgi:hypothetical protein